MSGVASGSWKRDEPAGTTVLVCQGRAVADGRLAPGRFTDPTARILLRDDEVAAVEQARSDEAPKGWSARMNWQLQRLNAVVNVPRTIAIDDAVRAGPRAGCRAGRGARRAGLADAGAGRRRAL